MHKKRPTADKVRWMVAESVAKLIRTARTVAKKPAPTEKEAKRTDVSSAPAQDATSLAQRAGEDVSFGYHWTLCGHDHPRGHCKAAAVLVPRRRLKQDRGR